MCKRFRTYLFSALVLLSVVAPEVNAQNRVRIVTGSSDNQMRVVDTYPEYWVDGKPFFQYGGAFFYYRLPRDRWAEEMQAFHAMGLNTLDVLPMWNWHEPEEGNLDFDGHTNPRRDLKHVLDLADALGLKITFRPGPYDTNEWRNGGYPDWLLRRPEYHMSEQSILEGRYPRWSAQQYDRSEASAGEWLKNETHLKYTRQWYKEVLGLASPYFADRGGPILSVQMDDDQAIGAENYNGPNFWKYLDTLRKFARQAIDDWQLIYYIDGAQMRVNAESNDALPEPFWNQGQDYPWTGPGGYSTPAEAAKNKFLLEIVKTQPLFIPAHIEFQAGWWPTLDDTFARQVDASNTLMASRVMLQNGLKAVSYFPPNDTLNPAGYAVPWSNHFYIWEAALNYLGQETGRAVYVRRNGRLIAGMGPLLASSHLLADAGIVYPMATFAQEALTGEEAQHVAALAGRLLWAGAYDHRSFELVDSDHTPLENFQRYRVLLAPNLVNGRDDKRLYPHLERYSEKAQQMLADYVDSGGTLIVFPSLPRGKVFDRLLEAFGSGRSEPGDSPLKFSDGSNARALGFHSVLILPKKPRTEVKVFARDARGGVVGARLAYGKGHVIFFGADFSTWSLPAGAEFTLDGTVKAGPRDYSEDVQQAARLALPALLKEAGESSKVYPDMKAEKGRDLGLYATELVADAGSLAFEKRGDTNGFGFVGVTNFSVDTPRTAEIVVTDPRNQDLTAAPERSLRLPALTVPPRESLLLPIRVPLQDQYAENAPGLDATDEIYYATAEVSHVVYDGEKLKLELTVPTEGEVALRLSRRPAGAALDGQVVSVQEDTQRHLYLVKVPRGPEPHFLRSLEIAYPQDALRVKILPRLPWIAGETRAVRVRVENPGPAEFAGELDFVAGSLYRAENPPLRVHVPARGAREFSFPVEIPGTFPPNEPVDLTATLRARNSSATWAWHSQATVHRPFDFSVGPVLTFPLREDVQVPIVHPTLMSLRLPGIATIVVRVKNWQDREQAVTVAASGDAVALDPPLAQLVLPAGGEKSLEIHAKPGTGSGRYRIKVELGSGTYRVDEAVDLAAISPGEAIAYVIDYDRDGFPDVILENAAVRLFVSPNAGGRAFAFVNKATGANAFNSVGGMRDNFTKRVAPEDLRGLPGWTQADWLGLFNRPYAFHIESGSGAKAVVRLEYSAPDIYPKGVKVERTLTLPGDASLYYEDTALTAEGVSEPQAFVLENSTTFKMYNDAGNFRQWFAAGRGPEDFVPEKNVDLARGSGFLGTLDTRGGATFAMLSLSPLAKSQLAVHGHAATLRFIYPELTEKNRTYTYRAAYFFGKATPQEIQQLYGRLAGR